MTRCFRFKASLVALAFCCIIIGHAAAQSTKISEPILVNGDNNEDSKSWLDYLAITAGEDKLIIMIARRGSKEISPKLAWRRLKTASSYLVGERLIPKQRTILAEGEVIRGQGRIEVYLDGKLFMVIRFVRNKDFAPSG